MTSNFWQTTIKSWSIEHQQISNIATWMKADAPTNLPEPLQGIFFMDGNPLPDDCITMYNSPWDAENLTLSLPVFGSRQWTFHATVLGLILLWSVKLSRLVYEIQFEDETLQRAKVIPVIWGLHIPRWLISLSLWQQEGSTNGDTWRRENSWLSGLSSAGSYTLRKIVTKDGAQTPAFADMQAKINDECLVIAKD